VLNAAPVVFAYDDLFAAIDVLIANEVEAEQLVGTNDPAAALHRLPCARRGNGNPVARRCWCRRNGAWRGAGRCTADRGVDTAGAGDVLCGALAAGLALRLPLRRRAGWAVRAASLSVTRRENSRRFPRARSWRRFAHDPLPWWGCFNEKSPHVRSP